VIVLQVNVSGIIAFKLKCDSPISCIREDSIKQLIAHQSFMACRPHITSIV
jgi:hypothetical protein